MPRVRGMGGQSCPAPRLQAAPKTMTDPNTPTPVATIAITDSAGGHVRTSLHSAETAQDLTDRILYTLAICEHVPTEKLAQLATNRTTLIKMRDAATVLIQQLQRTEAALHLMVSIAQSNDLDAWEQFRQGVIKGAQQGTTPQPIKNGMRPVHPGEILREDFMAPLNSTVYGVATGTGLDDLTVGELVNEQISVTPEIAERLAEAYGNTTPEFWLNLQAAYDQRVKATEATTPTN